MNTMTWVGPLAATLVLTGCSKPTIDASSEEVFFHSAGRMAQSLPVEEREVFNKALMLVTMEGVDFTAELADGEQLDFAGAIARLDGMSAEDIIVMAEDLRRLYRIAAVEYERRHFQSLTGV